MSIKKQFLLTMILLIIMPLLIIPSIGYMYIKETMQEQLFLQNEQNLDRIIKDVNNVLEEMISASNAIILNDDIIFSLEKNNVDIQEIKEIEYNLSKVNAAQLFSYNADIYVYNLQGEIYATTANQDRIIMDEYKKKWIQDTLEMKGYFNWTSFPHYDKKNLAEYPVIGMARNILDINGKTVGVLSIEMLNERKISSMLYNVIEYKDTERYLIDQNGNIILGYINNSKQYQLYQKQWFEDYKESIYSNQHFNVKFNGENQVILNQPLQKIKWSVLQITPHKQVFKKLLNYRNFTISINIILLCIIIILIIVSANRLTRSIMRLRDAMQLVKEGKFINIDIEKGSKEIKDLSKDFNIMSTKLDNLFKENKRIYKEKQRTKLEALHFQIQPHFLLNTLNGIKWLCIMENAKTAEKMLISLGYILEYSLSKSKETNTLREEIDCLKHYIEIQKMRYGETFEVNIKIEEKLNNIEVPILFLQPIIENSIIHGLQYKEDKGHIWISARKEGETVYITIEDDGCGIDEYEMNQVLSSKIKPTGIGILNVKQRIQLYYGIESSLEICNRDAGGTKVVLKLAQRSESDK